MLQALFLLEKLILDSNLFFLALDGLCALDWQTLVIVLSISNPV